MTIKHHQRLKQTSHFFCDKKNTPGKAWPFKYFGAIFLLWQTQSWGLFESWPTQRLVFTGQENILSTKKEINLQDIINFALTHNPQIKSAQLSCLNNSFSEKNRQEDFRWQYQLSADLSTLPKGNERKTNTAPQLSLMPAASKQGKYGTETRLNLNLYPSYTHNKSANLFSWEISQPLGENSRPSINTATLVQSARHEEMNHLILENSMTQALMDIIYAYHTVIFSKESIKIARLSLTAYKQNLALEKKLFLLGKRSKTEVLQAEADYENAKLNVALAKSQLLQDKLTLLNSIGAPQIMNIKFSEKILPSNTRIPSFKQAIQIALKNNTDYLIQTKELAIEKEQLLIDKPKTGLQLALALQGKQLLSPLKKKGQKQRLQQESLHFSLPIHDQADAENIVNDKIQIIQSKILLNNLKKSLSLSISTDLNSISSDFSNRLLAKKVLTLQKKNQNVLKKKLYYGLISNFEINSKQENLDKTRLNYLLSEINYRNAIIQLEADMGILSKHYVKYEKNCQFSIIPY